MQFVANLRPRTIEAFEAQQIQPSAYLLSTHRANQTTLKHAHALRDKGIPLVADNGTKRLIEAVIDTFSEAARAITDEVRRVRKQIGRIPRGKAVPSDLRRRASDLANDVVAECTRRSEEIDSEDLLVRQLEMRPTQMIAQEDFAVACLMALGLERETTGRDVRSFDRRNQRSLRLFERVARDPRCRELEVFAVLGAMDYNTARSAGKLAANFGASHVAVGIASITRDPTATDFYVMGRASRKVNPPAPRRYVRFTQIIRGIVDGYREVGKPLESFHALGLGAPVLLPVFAAAADNVPNLTTDATSPIHDAVRDNVLYDPERNGSRVSLLNIVRRLVDGQDWSFSCPFCEDFREEFGHSADEAHEWWVGEGKPKIEESHLQEVERLAEAVPLFSDFSEQVAKRASRTHIAHNHFVLGELALRIPDDDGRREFAMRTIEELVASTSSVTTRGLRAALEILRKPLI